ncbi:hypothetical protein A5790_05275 [Mycobacterium sp. 852002-51152_SCH6134967]|uniref:hypothetical protein n=1 Tax=Mycobacterium sp. 852002-51152_SCH6134967 TaxID=1834096 RepID=UPI0007FF6287|nr:hypothetical protein [Mycobacterium sp. 852002-51152_SCH6134967]OBF96442.1 hypothetical protein A5790_05275 [Mycobacterium sp. 852002-51152_SCH6134967]
MAQLAAGQYRWPKGTQGPGHKVSDIPFGVSGSDLRGFAGGTQQVSGVLRIEMDLAASAQVCGLPRPSSSPPHERKANMGYGNATPNNAPTGEGPLSRGRSGW